MTPRPMPLNPGDEAPDFTLYDDARQPWTLSDHLGRGPVLLLFFPGAFTSACTTEMSRVNEDLLYYRERAATVVGLSTDSPDVLAEFRRSLDLRFSLLSDHDAVVAERYGVRFSVEEHLLGFSRVAKRAAFVVSPAGRIAYAEVLPTPMLEPDYDAILDVLE